jgi:hypothetical protein
MNHDNFCVYPFMQIVSRNNGGLGPCCVIHSLSNIKQTKLPIFWQHPGMDHIRSQMLEGNGPISECLTCKRQESSFASSMRTEGLRDYGFASPDHYEQRLHSLGWHKASAPKRLEIHVGNTCNLKCLTCNPRDSSMFLDENLRLNISHHHRQEFTYSHDQLNDIFNWIADLELDLLDLRGGESMLSPVIKHRLQHLPDNIYDRTVLRVQTNGTIYDRDWQTIFDKFSRLELMVSIDGYQSINEYVRFPSDWNTIQRNLDSFRSHSPQQLFINTVVSNLNFLSLDQLLQWSYDKDIYCHLAPLTMPEIFQFQNLPASIFNTAVKKLRHWDHHPKVGHLIAQEPLQDPNLWRDFCRMIDKRDRHRKNRIFDIYPDFQDVWLC